MSEASILHISDLHYVSQNSNYLDDNKADLPAALRATAFRNLDALLTHGFSADRCDAVAIGGDITTHGQPRGFDLFDSSAANLVRALVANPKAICLVAGNHDVVWNLDPREPDYFDRKFARYRATVQRLEATTCLIPTGAVPQSDDEQIRFDTGVPEPLYIDRDKKFLVLCINSSMRCGEVNVRMRGTLREPVDRALSALNRPGAGVAPNELMEARTSLEGVLAEVDRRSLFDIPHVTHVQLSVLSDLLMRAKADLQADWQQYVKIALLHHHVVPFDYQMPEYKAFEVMADAAPTLEALGSFGFQVVLTGHKHQPYTQQIQFCGSEMLVVGGATVGGYAVPGFGQAVRHLDIERNEICCVVRVADIPCSRSGDLQKLVQQAKANASVYTVRNSHVERRLFPVKIEQAVEQQLYDRSFFKTNVAFDVEVTQPSEDELTFETKFSYGVVNRTSDTRKWSVDYKYERGRGTIKEARIGGTTYPPEQLEFGTARGLSIPVNLAPEQRVDVYLHVIETRPVRGSALYTSYNPATDLRVTVRSSTPEIGFDFEPLYFLESWEALKHQDNYYEILFDKGILPYQGLRLNWKPKKEKGLVDDQQT